MNVRFQRASVSRCTRLPKRQAFHFLLFSRSRGLGMRYNRIIRADKRDLMRYEEVRT